MPRGKYVRTPENRELMRKVNLGKKHTELAKEKMKEKRKGKVGKLAPNFGKNHSLESKLKISKKLKNRFISKEHREKISLSLKKHKRTLEHSNNISKSKKGGKPWNKGVTHTFETRKKLSDAHKGEKHKNWQGGKTAEADRIRQSFEYKNWRTSVYKRDKYTCQICGEKNKRLNADHIKPFAGYPELRFDINNGRTLCEDCHKKTPTYGANRFRPYIT